MGLSHTKSRMSQTGGMTDGARTRGRASTGTLNTKPADVEEQPTTESHSESEADGNPQTVSMSNIDNKLDAIMKRLDSLGKLEMDLADIRENNNQQMSKVEEDNRILREGIARLTGMLEESELLRKEESRDNLITKHELSKATEINRRMRNQINELENRMRICNIRIEGVREDLRDDLLSFVLNTAHNMGVDTISQGDIVAAYRVGKKLQTNQQGYTRRTRAIVITFTNEQKRNEFYFARAKLHKQPEYKGVYINDDVSHTTRKLRDEFRSVAALARTEGAEVRIHSDGILINARKYLLTEAHNLPTKFSLPKAKTLEIDGELYFASEHSYLSNFAESPITVGNVVFSSAEQMYQALKCKDAGSDEKYEKVLVSVSPVEAKRIADSLPESQDWKDHRDAVMEKVVGLKFDQNPALAIKLAGTGDKVLNEATHNSYFGIGVPLHDRQILDKSYSGQNILGKILMKKRDSIKQKNN